MQETQVRDLGREDQCRREWLLTPVFLPGELHGQEPGGLQSIESHSVEHNSSTNTNIHTHTHIYFVLLLPQLLKPVFC